ncbi:hypothetical protein GCM10010112_41560 [Actinoplanes lobatus]|uniref:Serine/threonine protein phosphatase PrpC n=1 Tax=Actinoplanes lobatus TaxID=113568 RepID=A0A7W7HNE2_9ACTN|nr:MerR family transcriptional regulator [Actinoplanes lobatus]MBB4753729.1 serine/threonine protein phosphatase PrpC [Actinoplanes lobatus]GGN72812.1 hypothetical protein GCM10010112_41560 [Actinoplanes lobatus]GIE42118.1 hypothetical protein Alo02nite_50160 [Actinoplanes lobatus]
MGLLAIGAFARAVRMTPKALRLYDELGLLPPAAVDPESGYRFYHPDQRERARLIARLRRIGMPLAAIRTVCDRDPRAVAEAVAAYWGGVTADTADRAREVTALVGELSGAEHAAGAPAIRRAARTDRGAVRDSDEDVAYAGDRLLAVADGIRGSGGAAAARAAVGALEALEALDRPAGELLAVLAAAIDGIDETVRGLGAGDDRPATTLTAMLRHGDRLALVHIGDTRAYLLRGGELSLLTRDHTWVRDEVDRGRLTPVQAASHPRRALLSRALGGGRPVEADLALRTARPGDRYLLCSDGLSSVVSPAALRDTLAAEPGCGPAVDRLIELAYAAGAPDNIACVVADMIG